MKTIDKWYRFMENTPGYNEHATFLKGECKVELWLGTNCGQKKTRKKKKKRRKRRKKEEN